MIRKFTLHDGQGMSLTDDLGLIRPGAWNGQVKNGRYWQTVSLVSSSDVVDHVCKPGTPNEFLIMDNGIVYIDFGFRYIPA